MSARLPSIGDAAVADIFEHASAHGDGVCRPGVCIEKLGLPLVVLPVVIVVAQTPTFGIGLLLFCVFLSFAQKALGGDF